MRQERVHRSFNGYAVAQMRKMESGVYKGYMGDKRRSLVERFGYDTKNASHLIRLLRQGAEFLRDGELYVLRHDASELVAIKRGDFDTAHRHLAALVALEPDRPVHKDRLEALDRLRQRPGQ